MEMTTFQDDGGSGKKDQIISSFIPPFETIHREVRPFHKQLQISLEEGVRLAVEYFDEKKLAKDAFLLNQLIRYHTKRLMKEKANINLYEMDDLANNGLSGSYARYHIRVFKENRGNIPIPNSDVKTSFFCQQTEMIFEDIPRPTRNRPNVFFLWDLDGNYSLTPLRLVCPQYAEKNRDVTRTYYDEVVPNPVFEPEPRVASNELPELPIDLDIKLKGKETETKTGDKDDEQTA